MLLCPDIGIIVQAISVEGQRTSLQTNYILKILGLDICADTLFGDAMKRNIWWPEKRLTTGEMIVGPTKALFMDEISNGLDSSTTYQIVCCLQQLAHISDATIVVSLLQPAPETFDLFDDVILMGEGKTVYHGPRSDVLEFFRNCGFGCPERKGVADFLQEVISKKDQEHYWLETRQPYTYVSVDMFAMKFKESAHGKNLTRELSVPFDKSNSHKSAISFSVYSLSRWTLFRACMSREFLLMKRNVFMYVFKISSVSLICSLSSLLLWNARALHDYSKASSFLQTKDLNFYPAWAYAIPATILKIPMSLLEALIWTCLTYYVIGFSPEAGRFFRQMILVFSVHLTSSSMFRFLAALFRTVVASTTAGSLAILFVMLFSGFIIPRQMAFAASMPVWLKWAFWVSPLSYGEIGLSSNEFLAPRWQKDLTGNTTIGHQTLANRGLDFTAGSRAIISSDQLSKLKGSSKELDKKANIEEHSKVSSRASVKYQGEMVCVLSLVDDLFMQIEWCYPFNPKYGIPRRAVLCGHPSGHEGTCVLTALMGVSGAGKTTLLDVLSGRKTSGTIEGEIKIGGYPKVQSTFSRISGYCEQTDIHSPQITVQESVIFSAWLRLDPQDFVKEVLETIELDSIKDSLVGLPSVDGLSTEQRKRLTIAVELVANPSIIFMDEPTTGLDARAAAIVMRAVRNVANTGRTIVCTIHQPSIDIFEAFDEAIPGVEKIRDNYNPAAWMLEVTSTSSEAELGLDFAEIYKKSSLHESNKELANKLSIPPAGSKDLHFSTRYPQNGWEQFKACLWKQHWSYWRSPKYNVMRSLHMIFAAFLFGLVFWNQGKKCNFLQYYTGQNLMHFCNLQSLLHNQQSLFTLLGSMYASTLFCGINNSSSVLPYVSTERTVLYREKFAGMYASWAYSAAQVIVEIPYLFAQSVVFTVITYPMIGYYWTAYKVFFYIYTMFCTLLYFTYLGMLLIAITPSFPVAAISQSAFYTMFNLFAGFLVPHPQIPRWWIWFITWFRLHGR
ncbi:hypothetical protein SASPL_131685 [Salvia splendens]|uniref:ABC transporter domain-containing protein n=1 Tax=Salvia splendens TaxID=180675 RepID=A0A8X8X978_SALSN|nr:hypothetical protein SASPL_131685 [Salvia splendens]